MNTHLQSVRKTWIDEICRLTLLLPFALLISVLLSERVYLPKGMPYPPKRLSVNDTIYDKQSKSLPCPK